MSGIGDLSGNISRLVRDLKGLKYAAPIDEVGLKLGDPISFLPLLHYVLLKFSRHVARFIIDAGFELQGKTDKRFIESTFRLLRECCGVKTVLTASQFLEQGFAERKVLLLCDVVQWCKKTHNDELRKERLAALKHRSGPPASLQRGHVPTIKTPEVKVIKAIGSTRNTPSPMPSSAGKPSKLSPGKGKVRYAASNEPAVPKQYSPLTVSERWRQELEAPPPAAAPDSSTASPTALPSASTRAMHASAAAAHQNKPKDDAQLELTFNAGVGRPGVRGPGSAADAVTPGAAWFSNPAFASATGGGSREKMANVTPWWRAASSFAAVQQGQHQQEQHQQESQEDADLSDGVPTLPAWQASLPADDTQLMPDQKGSGWDEELEEEADLEGDGPRLSRRPGPLTEDVEGLVSLYLHNMQQEVEGGGGLMRTGERAGDMSEAEENESDGGSSTEGPARPSGSFRFHVPTAEMSSGQGYGSSNALGQNRELGTTIRGGLPSVPARALPSWQADPPGMPTIPTKETASVQVDRVASLAGWQHAPLSQDGGSRHGKPRQYVTAQVPEAEEEEEEEEEMPMSRRQGQDMASEPAGDKEGYASGNASSTRGKQYRGQAMASAPAGEYEGYISGNGSSTGGGLQLQAAVQQLQAQLEAAELEVCALRSSAARTHDEMTARVEEVLDEMAKLRKDTSREREETAARLTVLEGRVRFLEGELALVARPSAATRAPCPQSVHQGGQATWEDPPSAGPTPATQSPSVHSSPASSHSYFPAQSAVPVPSADSTHQCPIPTQRHYPQQHRHSHASLPSHSASLASVAQHAQQPRYKQYDPAYYDPSRHQVYVPYSQAVTGGWRSSIEDSRTSMQVSAGNWSTANGPFNRHSLDSSLPHPPHPQGEATGGSAAEAAWKPATITTASTTLPSRPPDTSSTGRGSTLHANINMLATVAPTPDFTFKPGIIAVESPAASPDRGGGAVGLGEDPRACWTRSSQDAVRPYQSHGTGVNIRSHLNLAPQRPGSDLRHSVHPHQLAPTSEAELAGQEYGSRAGPVNRLAAMQAGTAPSVSHAMLQPGDSLAAGSHLAVVEHVHDEGLHKFGGGGGGGGGDLHESSQLSSTGTWTSQALHTRPAQLRPNSISEGGPSTAERQPLPFRPPSMSEGEPGTESAEVPQLGAGSTRDLISSLVSRYSEAQQYLSQMKNQV